ncbi:hypothetical protein A3D77_03055 [Candidatus Gottesmanbacteria bacterium RIFCSPHIGHO2_02_FULL_39_11]|uniref:Uncharacterized protein n=1 Tax=Candidatus Gottesmanbacteria bacterium RIFCSPHIGHO2_02_FULL_39_11 TaxID=1798382 RepID=A0A1F5ZLN3_9BACT|nr:MAG: hypothetical protein A3D77_03055 [Candidatus Gottesmanbacteria bacterium RIFCSPHIGHO2_02_FULL_39_11]
MLLKSAGELTIDKIINSHMEVKPLLHEKAHLKEVDTSAFIYSLLRLPPSMSQVKKIILGQSYSVFKKNGWSKISRWKEVVSPGRRRKMYWDGKDTLAMYITSVSDVDDVITLLTAFQIEWNKLHQVLKNQNSLADKTKEILDAEGHEKIKKIWGPDYYNFLTAIKHREVSFTVKLLAGSYSEYAKATNEWWHHVENSARSSRLADRPIYFISSNTHSVINVLTRFVKEEESVLVDYLNRTKDSNLLMLWNEIERGSIPIFREHFLYYISKKYAKLDSDFIKRKKSREHTHGIHTISAGRFLDIDAQVVEMCKLGNAKLDERVGVDTKKLHKSEAVIVNIDYPLGWAAYQILTAISHRVDSIRGIYIMGKAAALVGEIGDILIPTTIFDQHSKNLYSFSNTFSRSDFAPIFKTGSIFDNLKTMTAKGTFLQSAAMIKKWYESGFGSIEMEGGPYLNAVYELLYYNRYEENQSIHLTNLPFDLGIVHYTSDTPYSKAKNLGVRNLSFEGVESTYAASLAIVKKIIETENKYL